VRDQCGTEEPVQEQKSGIHDRPPMNEKRSRCICT
jgi:hypothetical protein